LWSLIEELENPELAGLRIVDAFREVKAWLRHSGHATLVDKHNAEYGATRNLCGARALLASREIIGLVACGFKGGRSTPTNAGSLVNLSILLLWPSALAFCFGLLLWAPLGGSILPEMLRVNANNYSESAWMSFLAQAQRVEKMPNVSLREPTTLVERTGNF
jgi:hypothetical protein